MEQKFKAVNNLLICQGLKHVHVVRILGTLRSTKTWSVCFDEAEH